MGTILNSYRATGQESYDDLNVANAFIETNMALNGCTCLYTVWTFSAVTDVQNVRLQL
jgi:hypothetical protein